MDLVKSIEKSWHKVKGFIRANRDVAARAAMTLVVALVSVGAMAQDMQTGVTAISSVSDALKNYLPAVRILCYVIAGIIGIVGGVGIVNKMNNQDQDVKKSIMLLVGSCIFLIAVGTFVPMFFGINN